MNKPATKRDLCDFKSYLSNRIDNASNALIVRVLAMIIAIAVLVLSSGTGV